jgi:hypothetical protein
VYPINRTAATHTSKFDAHVIGGGLIIVLNWRTGGMVKRVRGPRTGVACIYGARITAC